VVLGNDDATALRAFRNLAHVKTIDAGEINAYDVLDCDWICSPTPPCHRERGRVMRDAMSILIRPVVSEKTYALMDRGTYVFVVDPRATKIDVRNAVEQAFNVKVVNVNTLTARQVDAQPSHRSRGTRPDSKRAISPSSRATRSISSRTKDCRGTTSSQTNQPGRRFQTVSDFADITKSTRRSRCSTQARTGGRNSYGRKTSRHRVVVTSSSTASSTSSATRTACRQGRGDRVRPNRTCRIACCTTPTARSATSSRPTA